MIKKLPRILLGVFLTLALLSALGYLLARYGYVANWQTRWDKLALRVEQSQAPQNWAADLARRLNKIEAPRLAVSQNDFKPEVAGLYDLVVMPFRPDVPGLADFRKQNPDSLVIGRVTAQFLPPGYAAPAEDWFFKDTRGVNNLTVQDQAVVNLKIAGAALADFYGLALVGGPASPSLGGPAPLWDGLIIEGLTNEPPFRRVGDLDNDNRSESGAALAQVWRDGWREFLAALRQRVGQGAILMGAGEAAGQTLDLLNGRLLAFSEGVAGFGVWQKFMADYTGGARSVPAQQSVDLVKVDSATPAEARLALGSVLLGDGFLLVDASAPSVWYDEYTLNLGLAMTVPAAGAWAPVMHNRAYEHGQVFVNMSGQPRTVDLLRRGYLMPLGTLSPEVNNGEALATLTVPPLAARVVVTAALGSNLNAFLAGARTFLGF